MTNVIEKVHVYKMDQGFMIVMVKFLHLLDFST